MKNTTEELKDLNRIYENMVVEGHTYIGNGDVTNTSLDPVFCKECGDRVGWMDNSIANDEGALVCDDCAKDYNPNVEDNEDE